MLIVALFALVVAVALLLASLACLLLAAVDAFRQSALQGVLCLAVPFYCLYFLLARSQHRLRHLLAVGLVVCPGLLALLLALVVYLVAETSPVQPLIFAVG